MIKLMNFSIDHFRSIEHVEITMPKDKPLVLFGPNNSGKSNIISAVHRALGERWPQSIEMLDSDFFMRDSEQYPEVSIRCRFNETYCSNRNKTQEYDHFALRYNANVERNRFTVDDESWPSISQKIRSNIQSILIDAERNIDYQLSYTSRYTLLSKFSHAIHKALSSQERETLKESYEQIKGVFESDEKFSAFFDSFRNSVKESVKGFVHHLEIDFSAYDPNNYANIMRIVAKEGNQTRTFNEFGTGEQQILLMAFAKAYMETFGASSIILILEEPEAHLHPLAQRWLKEYIYDVCKSMQVIVSTHCADFIDPSNLEGLVRVSKDDRNITRTIQLTPQQLTQHCIEAGVPESVTNEKGIAEFYAARLFPDALKGLFAEKVLLVEGPTEYLSLPIFFSKANFSLPSNGIEIISCGGKNNIPYYYRLFTAYGIECACLFDADESDGKTNDELERLLNIVVSSDEPTEFVVDSHCAYFAKDYETTTRAQIENYSDLEALAKNEYKAGKSKPTIARIIASLSQSVPSYIDQVVKLLCSTEEDAYEEDFMGYDLWEDYSSEPYYPYDDEIPF